MGKRYTKNKKGYRKEDIIETKQNKQELKEALVEMEEEIVEEKKEEKETKTSEVTKEQTVEKINEVLNTEDTVEQTEENKEKARNSAEKIAEQYKDKETFSMKDIIYLMKNSGMSYKQISQRMKQIADATEEYAKTQGPDFDRKEFLKKQMEEKLGKK